MGSPQKEIQKMFACFCIFIIIFLVKEVRGIVRTNTSDIDALHTLYVSTGSAWNFTSMGECINDNGIPGQYGVAWNFSRDAQTLEYLHDPCPIVVGDNTNFMGVGCECDTSYCKVTWLTLLCGNIIGEVPSALGSLDQLEHLSMFNNTLTGLLPSELGNLRELSYVDFASNSLTGALPASLGSCTQMQTFSITYNNLDSTFPAFLGDWPWLKNLYLTGNSMTGTLSSSVLSKMLNLSKISLHSNYFSGPLVSEFGLMTNLVYLDLHLNLFTGTVPSNIGDLSKLATLGLDQNLLTGVLPKSLGKLISLQGLFLHENRFETGGSELDIVNPSLQPLLTTIDISNNMLTGSVPAAFFELPSIESLVFGGNCFTGRLPSNICNARNLSTLAMNNLVGGYSCRKYFWEGTALRTDLDGYESYNFMEGTLPSCIFVLPKLVNLHASGNGFQGVLPTTFSPTLRELLLSWNKLSGTISRNLANNTAWQLNRLDLSHNRIQGNLNSFIGKPGEYFYQGDANLNLEVNRLSGYVPLALHTIRNISILDGNMFDCDTDSTNLPVYDPTTESYACGSDSMDQYMYIFFSCCAVAACAGQVVKNQYRNAIRRLYAEFKMWVRVTEGKKKISDEVSTRHIIKFSWYLREVRLLGMVLGVACFFVCIAYVGMTYSSPGSSHRTLGEIYSWLFTAAYLTGALPAVLLIVTSMSVLAITLYFITLNEDTSTGVVEHKLERVEIAGRNRNSDFLERFKRVFFASLRVFIIVVFIFGVLFGMNIWYVQVLITKDDDYQRIFKVFFSLFKLLWVMSATPEFFKTKYLFFGRTEEEHEEFINGFFGSKVSLMFLLSVVSSLIIPIMVASVSFQSCFKGIFIAQPTQYVLFLYRVCYEYLAGGTCKVGQSETFHVTTKESVPFVYGDMCSNSIMNAYVPLFQQMYLLLIARSAYQLCYLSWDARHQERGTLDTDWDHYVEGELSQQNMNIRSMFSNLMPMKYLLMGSRQRRAFYRKDLIFPTRAPDWVTRSIPHNLTALLLMLTFGILAPPLGIIIFSSIILDTYVVQLVVGRFMVAELSVLHECHRIKPSTLAGMYMPEKIWVSPERLKAMVYDMKDVDEPYGAKAVLKLVEEKFHRHMPREVLALGRIPFMFIPSFIMAFVIFDVLNADAKSEAVIWGSLVMIAYPFLLELFTYFFLRRKEHIVSQSIMDTEVIPNAEPPATSASSRYDEESARRHPSDDIELRESNEIGISLSMVLPSAPNLSPVNEDL